MLDKHAWRQLDWSLLITVVCLIGLGLAAIFSATHHEVGHGEFVRQLLYLVPATLTALLFVLYDYAWLYRASHVIYWVNLSLLTWVLLGGHSALGAQRWINLGFMTIQPSEFAKLALIVTLARVLSLAPARSPQTLLKVGLHVGIPALLIFRQPDLGTSLVFGAITLGMLIWAGLPAALLFALVSPIISLIINAWSGWLWTLYLIGLAWWLYRWLRLHWSLKTLAWGLNVAFAYAIPVVWGLLKPYQRQRLVVFMNPEGDPLGSGYHIIQSKVAIGSGGLTGKGYLEGTQTQLHFIPEQHTDFIFSVIGEELGFLGGVLVILLFLLLAWRGVAIAERVRDPFGSLIVIGIISMMLFHFFVNVGMTTGIMPVTGIPLPFISAGGTSLLTNCTAIGLLLSIGIRRRKSLPS